MPYPNVTDVFFKNAHFQVHYENHKQVDANNLEVAKFSIFNVKTQKWVSNSKELDFLQELSKATVAAYKSAAKQSQTKRAIDEVRRWQVEWDFQVAVKPYRELNNLLLANRYGRVQWIANPLSMGESTAV